MPLDINADKLLDAKGKSCPGPIIALKKAMKTLNPGQILEVQATDSGAKADFKAWTEESGHTLLTSYQENGVFTFFIQKGEA